MFSTIQTESRVLLIWEQCIRELIPFTFTAGLAVNRTREGPFHTPEVAQVSRSGCVCDAQAEMSELGCLG